MPTEEEIAAEAEAARLAAMEAAKPEPTAEELEATRLAAEAEANKGKTSEELEADKLAEAETARLAAEAAKKPDWREERLGKVTADKAALIARLAQYETSDGKPKVIPEGDLLPKAEIERLANERAAAMASTAAFNAACNAARTEALKTYSDFDTSVQAMGLLIKDDPEATAAYDELLGQALETGEAGKIIYQLGKDLDLANDLLKLPAGKRAMRIAQMAVADAPPGSILPKPITPVKGKNSGPSEIAPSDPARADNLSSPEWHKRRAAEVAAAEEARQGGRRRAAH